MDNSHSHNHNTTAAELGIGINSGSGSSSIRHSSGSGHENWDNSGNNLSSSITPPSHRDYSYTQCYTYTVGSGQAVAHVNNSTSSRTARSSLSEMDSVSEADENNKLLEFSPASQSAMEEEDQEGEEEGEEEEGEETQGLLLRTNTENNILGDQDKSSETSRLLPSTTGVGIGVGVGTPSSNLNLSESNQNQMSPPPQPPPPSSSSSTTTIIPPTDAIHKQLSHHQTAADILNKRESSSYHFKRKYNFRSDSVFSDVTPTTSSSQENPKSPGPEVREKSGSLSSLKGHSKWASLRKKLGRLNSSSSEKHQQKALEHQAHLQQQLHQQHQQQHHHHHSKTAKVSLEEKRSLLQRAKTLSILPVRGVKEEMVKKPKEAPRPPELFNVGGEMNMIPLELLIDINDLKIQQ